MPVILGPVLTRESGYAFDAWSPEGGLRRGFVYRRIEDAYYARDVEIRVLGKSAAGDIAYATVDEFAQSPINGLAGVLEPVSRNLGKFRSVP